jgi:hypothetical protein
MQIHAKGAAVGENSPQMWRGGIQFDAEHRATAYNATTVSPPVLTIPRTYVQDTEIEGQCREVTKGLHFEVRLVRYWKILERLAD